MRTNAAAVAELHAEYLAAGADVLRTNTFQLNRRIYQDVFRDAAHMRQIGAPGLDRRVTELVPLAVRLAQSDREGAGRAAVAIVGVMSPLEHCFRPDLARQPRNWRRLNTPRSPSCWPMPVSTCCCWSR